MKGIMLTATLFFALPCVGRVQAAAQPGEDISALESAIAGNPGDAGLYVKLGFAYSRMHRVDEAQSAFENAVRLDPSRAAAHYMLGLIYEKKGLKEKAIEAWKACMASATDPGIRDTAARHLHHLAVNR